MKILVTLSIALSMTLSILASGARAEETFLNELARLYNNATVPSEKVFDGWFTGRCVSNAKPNIFINSLLVGTLDKQNDGGPLYPGRPHFAIYTAIDRPAGHFDNADIDQVLRDSIHEQISVNPPIRATMNGFSWTATSGTTEWLVREHLFPDYYLFVKIVEATTRTEYYCYYFKKVG